jgi:hypothetical protein
MWGRDSRNGVPSPLCTGRLARPLNPPHLTPPRSACRVGH